MNRPEVECLSVSVARDMNDDGGSDDLKEKLKRLEEENQRLREQAKSQPASQEAPQEEPLIYADQTLRRLVQRIAMILQAEKIVIMFYDRERAELIGIEPGFG